MMPVDDEKLGRYQALWSEGASGEWVLLKDSTGACLPYNLNTRLAKVIEDDDLSFAVVEKMLKAGVRVLDDPPEPWKP